MKRLQGWALRLMARFVYTMDKRFYITATPEENEYLAWADTRLDHMSEHANWAKRGYRLLCHEKGCDFA